MHLHCKCHAHLCVFQHLNAAASVAVSAVMTVTTMHGPHPTALNHQAPSTPPSPPLYQPSSAITKHPMLMPPTSSSRHGTTANQPYKSRRSTLTSLIPDRSSMPEVILHRSQQLYKHLQAPFDTMWSPHVTSRRPLTALNRAAPPHAPLQHAATSSTSRCPTTLSKQASFPHRIATSGLRTLMG